jgi:hypothetical protein
VRIYTTVTDTLSTGKTTERNLVIDGRPAIKIGDVIPIVFYAGYAGEFMLRVSEFRGCDTLAVWFVDKLANKEFKLNGGGIYYFSSRSGEVAERFTLEFRTAPVGNEVVASDEMFFAWCSAPGTISVRGASASDRVEVFDLMGRLVYSSFTELQNLQNLQENILNAKNGTTQSREDDNSLRLKSLAPFAFSINNLKAGIYIVRCGGESVKVVVKN